jgi:putative transposase
MVRAGEVKHPMEWGWCGYQELMGVRDRYRIVEIDALLSMLGYTDIKMMREQYKNGVNIQIARGNLTRNPIWSENLAVGGRSFIDEMKKKVFSTRKYLTEGKSGEELPTWSIRDTKGTYFVFRQ